MNDLLPPSKINLEHAEKQVVFLICDCSLHKDYSFWKLTRDQAERLIARLRHIEKLTWKQFANLPRASGLTTENPESGSFIMIDGQNSSAEKFVEKYYFHFRIEEKGIFRVFGYQKKQFFCITHLDRDGLIHH